MISAICGVNSLSRVSVPSFKGRRQVLPENGNDSFIPSIKAIDGNITDEDAARFLKTTENFKNCVGCGYTSYVFKTGKYAIKSPRTDHSDKYWIGVGNDKILKEYAILKKISDISPDIAVKPVGLIQKKGFYHIVEDFIDGCHPYDNNMNDAHLKDLMSKFTQLDKNGICSADLQSANIFFLKDGSSRLIDLGSYTFLSDNGSTIPSDGLPVEFYKEDGKIGLDKLMNTRSESRYAASFFNKNKIDIACDMKNYADNPYLNTKSNISNFEFRNLFTFLREDYVKNPMEILKNYVKAKGEIYHAGMHDFLKKVNIDENDFYIKMSEEKSSQSVKSAKQDLQNAIHYEELAKEVLSNPTEEVLKAEAAKIQLKMFFNPDSWHSSIPHEKGLQDAYNQTIEILKDNISKTEGKTKEYFTETLNGLQERFKNVVFADEQLKIPDDENLIKKLFPESQISKLPQKKYSMAKILGSAAFCSAIAGIIKHKYGSDKQDKKIDK